jgi:hypothetical protein
MKYQFRPYAKMQPTEVTLTGKVYEKGEHPLYTEHKIIEVVDEEGETHYAFEDELKSDEVEEQERSYSEEDMIEASKYGYNFHKTTIFPEQEFEDSCIRNTQQWLTQFKK